MTNGLTQGAPELAFLFNIVLIPMVLAINHAGIGSPSLASYLSEVHHRDEANKRKAYSYSDDTQIIINFKEEDIKNTLQIVRDFTLVSGQGLNEDKNTAILSFIPTNSELEMLECCSILRKNVFCSEDDVKILGLNFNISQDPQITSKATLHKIHEELASRMAKWTILSNNVLGRKLLANTLLIAKLNYHLPWLSGLKEADFSKIKKSLNAFIFKKNILGLDLKFASAKKGGLGAPYLFNRYVTAQSSWLRKIIKYDKVALSCTPDWILPIKAMLNRYGLCDLRTIICLGPSILKHMVSLLREENLFFLANTLEVFLAKKKLSMLFFSGTSKETEHPHPSN